MEKKLCTIEEVQIWRERAKNGPYKTTGDVAPNSPGDWDRILNNANSFLTATKDEYYKGPEFLKGVKFTGLVPKMSVPEPQTQGVKLKDAAFVYLITGEVKYLEAVKKAILLQIAEPLVDFSNTTRWGDLRDVNPGFFIAEWVSRLHFAYEYTKEGWNSAEKALVEKWLITAAMYFKGIVDGYFALPFTDRYKGDYTLTGYGKAVNFYALNGKTPYDGGVKLSKVSSAYNNRISVMVRSYGLIGLFMDNAPLINSAKLFYKEWLRFSVYPDGIIGEYERASSGYPDHGLYYASLTIGALGDLAEIFARNGDEEMLRHKTSEGISGSEGGEKDLLLTIKRYCSFIDGSFQKTKFGKVINGIIPEKNWYMINQVIFSKYNLFYRDPYLSKIVKSSFPAKAATNGSHQPFSGVWELHPGLLFMYDGLENKVYPYPASKSPQFTDVTGEVLKEIDNLVTSSNLMKEEVNKKVEILNEEVLKLKMFIQRLGNIGKM